MQKLSLTIKKEKGREDLPTPPHVDPHSNDETHGYPYRVVYAGMPETSGGSRC